MLGAVCDTWVKVQSFILFDSSECLRASDERTGVCVKQRDVLAAAIASLDEFDLTGWNSRKRHRVYFVYIWYHRVSCWITPLKMGPSGTRSVIRFSANLQVLWVYLRERKRHTRWQRKQVTGEVHSWKFIFSLIKPMLKESQLKFCRPKDILLNNRSRWALLLKQNKKQKDEHINKKWPHTSRDLTYAGWAVSSHFMFSFCFIAFFKQLSTLTECCNVVLPGSCEER